MKHSGIYRITCTESGVFYIGSAKNIYQRFQRHKSLLRHNKHPNPKLQAVWNKYGEDSLILTIEQLVEDQLQLFVVEQQFLDKIKPPLNINLRADNDWLGRNHTDESKAKIGAFNKGKKLSPEHLEKLRLANLGNKHNKGNKYRLGKTASEESKKKMSESHKAQKLSLDHLAAFHAHLGKPISDETKRKMSESRKIWWAVKKHQG